MAFMRICTLLVLALAAAWGTLSQAAQEDARETARPHVPPAASKSVEIANYYFKKKKYRAALSRYQEAAQTDPYYAPAYLGLGRVYEKIGLNQKALDAYRRYLDALPSTKDALEAKEAQQAIARLEKKLDTRRPRRERRPGPP